MEAWWKRGHLLCGNFRAPHTAHHTPHLISHDDPRLVRQCGHCRYWLRWYDAGKGTSQAASCCVFFCVYHARRTTSALDMPRLRFRCVWCVIVKSCTCHISSRAVMLCWRRCGLYSYVIFNPRGVTHAVFFFCFDCNDICSSLAFYANVIIIQYV